ncbi:MAG: hypothetical protein L3J76_05755, partial [Candidatus Hydrothermae bacterium]|nr:hypothetical protein [Candidatus Hydrothermae bacterium]
MYTYQKTFAMNVGHPEGRVIARLQLMRELERGERIRSVARRYKVSCTWPGNVDPSVGVLGKGRASRGDHGRR